MVSAVAWPKVWAVASREYTATVRTKAFLIAIVLMPILAVSGVLLPMLASHLGPNETRTCAVIDETGVVLSALQLRLTDDARSPRERPGSTPLDVEGTPTIALVDAGRAASDATLLQLSNRVRSGELFAFVHIPTAVLDPGSDARVVYTSNTPSGRSVRRWLVESIEAEVHRRRLMALGVDPQSIRRAQMPLRVEDGTLASIPGRESAPTPDPLRDVGVPLSAAMLLFMSLMLGATPLMQSTLEEKMYRIAEVLVSSVAPLPLMLGKLIGAALVSYTILGLYLGGGLLVASQFATEPLITWSQLALVALFQGIAFVTYGSIFLAVGSACNDLKETQSLMVPVVSLISMPLLLLAFVMDDPNGVVSTWLSFVPFFTPPLMLLRALIPPGAAPWQIVVGTVGSVSTALLCLYASSRIFRIGLLSQGSAPSYRQLWHWIRSA